MTVYRIKDWDTFEKRDHRRCSMMHWISKPTDLDSKGRGLILLEDDGFEILGIWDGILAVSARARIKQARGWLCDQHGVPYNARDIAAKIRARPKQIERAIEVLLSVGWIIEDTGDALAAALSTPENREDGRRDDPEFREDSGDFPEGFRKDSGRAPDYKDRDNDIERPKTSLVDSGKPNPTSLGSEVAQVWNSEVAAAEDCPLPRCREKGGKAKLPGSLKGKVSARRRDFDSDEEFIEEVRSRTRRIIASPHHTGSNDRGWRASLQWLLEPGGWEKAAAIMLPEERPRTPARASPASNRKPSTLDYLSQRRAAREAAEAATANHGRQPGDEDAIDITPNSHRDRSRTGPGDAHVGFPDVRGSRPGAAQGRVLAFDHRGTHRSGA